MERRGGGSNPYGNTRQEESRQTGIRDRLHKELTGLGTDGGVKLGGKILSLERIKRDGTLVNKLGYQLIKLIARAFKDRWDSVDSYQGLGQFRTDSAADNTAFGGLISPDEVREGLRTMKAGTASGPDGLSKKALLAWDPTGTKLAKMFSIWLMVGSVPKALKVCRTTLIPKSIDPAVCAHMSGWRTLTIGSVLMRLYSKLLNSRLTGVCSISPRQRGFISSPGCSENLMILNGLISETRRRGLGLAVVFIDFARAFDSVSHAHILEMLNHRGVDKHIIGVIQDCYEGVTTKVAVKGEEGPTIDMRIGVKKGDPMSPLLFNLALDP
ncbi:hypothetical protein DPEC_G00331690 [Dallia pectoralis]|uniref:Uncharacterized protein n=1 Tax=Dallia pectoralis TaxID=75939 RepID=A0ACC2F5W5_DALPE|nr:hypothetical protein DPEC_G00331690 [Dallia pectoralis]